MTAALTVALQDKNRESSRLTHDQTRMIFETNTIGAAEAIRVDDVVETANHFSCVDMILDEADHALSEKFIKRLYAALKSGTSDARLARFAVGDYKKPRMRRAAKARPPRNRSPKR